MERIVGAICLAFFTLQLNAAIVSAPDRIVDTTTNLAWLKLDATHNQSWNQVNARLQAGGDLHGWRFATSGEVDVLMDHFGALATLPCDNGYDKCSFVKSEAAFQAAHGMGTALWSVCDPTDPLCHGILFTEDPWWGWLADEAGAAGAHGVANVLADDGGFGCCRGGAFNPLAAYWDDDRSSPYAGSFLVSEVPLPAAAWLFLSALAGLGWFGRKTRQ